MQEQAGAVLVLDGNGERPPPFQHGGDPHDPMTFAGSLSASYPTPPPKPVEQEVRAIRICRLARRLFQEPHLADHRVGSVHALEGEPQRPVRTGRR